MKNNVIKVIVMIVFLFVILQGGDNMALTRPSTSTNNIQSLSDRPNQQDGLTPAQLKLKFDQYGIDNNEYLENLVDEIEAQFATKAENNLKANSADVYTKTEVNTNFATKTEVQNVALGQIPDGSLTDDKLSNEAGQLKDKVNSHLADYTKKIYNLSRKPRIINGVTGDSESGHYSTWDYTKAFDGIMTISNTGDGWINPVSVVKPWIKLSMPIGVIIGDSIAEGHPNTHGRLHTSDGLVDLGKLNEVGQLSYHIEQFVKFRVYNHGLGGDSLTQVKERWNRDVLAQTIPTLTPTSTLPKKPNFVIVVAGINDVWDGRTAEQIEEDFEYIITSAVTNNIFPIVFNIGPHSDMDAVKLAVVKEVNSWLLEKEKSTPTLKVIDFYSYANDPNNDGKPKAGLFADAVHPNKGTYERLARKVIEEAFTSAFPAVVPKYLNFSSAFNYSALVGSVNRPKGILVSVNDQAKKFYELPNSPDQAIKIPYIEDYIETIKVEILTHEIPYENSSTQVYVGWAELYLTDSDNLGLTSRNEIDNKPQCRVYSDTNQTITTSSMTPLAFNLERYDNALMHDISTNNTRVYAPISGLYDISGHVAWQTVTGGDRFLAIRVNGTTLIATNRQAAGVAGDCVMSISTTYYLNEGDYVELIAWHNKGSDLNVVATANYSPEFGLVKVD